MDGGIVATASPDELRTQLVDAVRELFTAGVMSHSGHANVSARADGETMVISNTGRVRQLRPDQFAVVRLDGEVVEGDITPENMEIVSMHTRVYRTRGDIGAIIHTHSPAVTGFALANRPLPCRYEALLRFGQAEDVPVVPWAPRGTPESLEGIVRTLQSHPLTSAVILANHGLLAFGVRPMDAAQLVEALEEAAGAELEATELGGAVDFPEGALDAVRAGMRRAL
ncbi:class II aldolase family protein [Micromonospora globispora]|uniref:Class II aldolase family protein n=1 Tax=Micromonospora globispora TaxID=1450148 RepID=A0A317JY74_9ACTN|nr:class II aldolase family protein [Micromonospora globispora]PWU58734.1 class II aldolase family protein [Micromonospora globispora]RQW84626.1 class II aldolase family protein [Micromonospora globispora]